jgi:hypothetical protein
MKRPSRAGLLAAGAALVLACGGSEPAQRSPEIAAAPAQPADPPVAGPEPVLIEPAAAGEIDVRFGLGLAADGAVTTPVLSFGAGDPICLSITLPAGGAGSTLALRWFDLSGALVGETTAALTGAPPRAALCLPGGERLPRGDYRIELEVDGRESGEATFSISDLRQSERAGGA